MPGSSGPARGPSGAADRLPDHVRHLAASGALCWAVFLLVLTLGTPNRFAAGLLALLLLAGAILLGGAMLGWVLLHHQAARMPGPTDTGVDHYRAD
jgi:hypothetical protein